MEYHLIICIIRKSSIICKLIVVHQCIKILFLKSKRCINPLFIQSIINQDYTCFPAGDIYNFEHRIKKTINRIQCWVVLHYEQLEFSYQVILQKTKKILRYKHSVSVYAQFYSNDQFKLQQPMIISYEKCASILFSCISFIIPHFFSFRLKYDCLTYKSLIINGIEKIRAKIK